MKLGNFKAPFLKTISLTVPEDKKEHFPFSAPLFSKDFRLEIENSVIILVGENGTGKSTLMEALAIKCGFNVEGGNRNYTLENQDSPLADAISLSWLPKINTGFFMRAESFFNFADRVDQIAEEDSSVLLAYGGKSLHEQSHGESFLSLFNHRFGQKGIYLLDEPEVALSPKRQLALLNIIHQMEQSGEAQFIIATHSPILMHYPNAKLYSLDTGTFKECTPEETEHVSITKEFLDKPERFLKHLID